MVQLYVAMPEKGSAGAFKKWDELSAGVWRDHIEICFLTDNKIANDAKVTNLSRSLDSIVYASQHLTSAAVTSQRHNIQRFKKHHLLEAVEKWLDEHDLDWRTRTKRHCNNTPFVSISAEEWIEQFAKVKPEFGRRAGAALLAQFRVIGPSEFSTYFSNLTEADQSTFFIGADPHSGDHALITILSASIDNSKLSDSRELPVLKKDAKVRLFCDGSWSGGETRRRIQCMFTACDKKNNALVATQRLDVHIGFLTDIAEKRIYQELEELANATVLQKGYVRVTYPEGNRLSVTGLSSGQRGLAFHDLTLLRYVDNDPSALRELCLKIGKEVLPNKPLGTNEIASCLAFYHSLPAAMLPLFTVDGMEVTDANGAKFTWKALLRSKHLATGHRAIAPTLHSETPLLKRNKFVT